MTEYAPIIEVNCETGERIIRQPNEQEIAQMKKDAEDFKNYTIKIKKEQEIKDAQKASAYAKLAVLGLTPEEIASL